MLDGIDAAQQSKWATPALNKVATPTYNPALARKILAKAGFKKGSNGMLLTPKGKPFTVNLVTASPFTDFVSMTSQLSSMLHAVGINTTITVTSVANYSTKMEDGSFSLGVMWGPSGPNPFYTINPLLNTAYSAPIGKPAPDNIERYSNPKIQKLAAEYDASTSVAVHKSIIDQMGRIMATQLPIIGLLNRNAPNEFSSKTIAGWPTASNPYWDNAADVGPIVVLTRLYAKN
jgi:peptide/nickel transport system substrate-binding protein